MFIQTLLFMIKFYVLSILNVRFYVLSVRFYVFSVRFYVLSVRFYVLSVRFYVLSILVYGFMCTRLFQFKALFQAKKFGFKFVLCTSLID